MYKAITIGDKEIPMLSVASCDLYYKNVFGQDPIKLQAKEDFGVADMVELFTRMGFIMAKYAELKSRKEMMKLNEEAFYDWMDGFEREDLVDFDKLAEIRDVYDGNRKTESESKKEEDQ